MEEVGAVVEVVDVVAVRAREFGERGGKSLLEFLA